MSEPKKEKESSFIENLRNLEKSIDTFINETGGSTTEQLKDIQTKSKKLIDEMPGKLLDKLSETEKDTAEEITMRIMNEKQQEVFDKSVEIGKNPIQIFNALGAVALELGKRPQLH